MNRTTTILGFGLLAVAVTMAAMITMRNRPVSNAPESITRRQVPPSGKKSLRLHQPTAGEFRGSIRNASDPTRRRISHRDSLHVSVSEEWLDSLTPEERVDWQNRVASVERTARGQLAELTEKLDLTVTQQRKIFPALVRAAPGYDSVMAVGGSLVASEIGMTPDEEIHAALESGQQAAVEDDEVDRQLWWADIIGRLEADLTGATGGAPMADDVSSSPDGSVPPTDERRGVPETRGDANLFDMIEPVR